ncbi:MAG: hypothetical protein P4L68_08065 [Methylovirgula sp.]|nr:hypothetical protein [Methylovirgula sp.]
MSDRVAQLREHARNEALDRALRFATAAKTTGNVVPPNTARSDGVHPPQAGETTCQRCGIRSSVGCKHMRRP